ncbi:hypothetical protein V1477_009482 [Vespula maculifrons]|uniref:Uncharacterized protein n=1 Tax=Vespula maculifrons TaxID=7453 RepID=A0ABD2C9X7_VESMC
MKTVKTQIRAYSGRHSANFTSFFGDQRANGMPSESGATAKSNIIGESINERSAIVEEFRYENLTISKREGCNIGQLIHRSTAMGKSDVHISRSKSGFGSGGPSGEKCR